MSSVQWRPQLNALTTPRSYKAQPVPKDSPGYDEIAVLIAAKNPLWSPGLVKSILLAEREVLKEQLVSGNQISYENTCVWHLSISARLDAPDDPLPPADEAVKVQIYASRPFIDEVRQAVQLERLPPSAKAPVIASTEDTVLKLPDVLNSTGVLRLTGTDMLFDPSKSGDECVLEGTRNGRTVQSRFGSISNTEIILVPQIPTQLNQWNNEYRLSITTRYTEHGSLRTGIYTRLLRLPLIVTIGNSDGILSGNGNTPLVIVSGGTVTEETAQVRVQAVLDARSGALRLSLLDMSENGNAGNEVQVSGNGIYTLPGFAGSAVTSLEITVQRYAALAAKVMEEYTGRLIDIVDVHQGT